jgi:hypothetical protein
MSVMSEAIQSTADVVGKHLPIAIRSSGAGEIERNFQRQAVG